MLIPERQVVGDTRTHKTKKERPATPAGPFGGVEGATRICCWGVQSTTITTRFQGKWDFNLWKLYELNTKRVSMLLRVYDDPRRIVEKDRWRPKVFPICQR